MDQPNQFKVFVSVTADFGADGGIRPLSFVWEDGNRYEIDRLLDARQAPSLKAGGYGLRFSVMVYGKPTFLWLHENRWFMGRK